MTQLNADMMRMARPVLVIIGLAVLSIGCNDRGKPTDDKEPPDRKISTQEFLASKKIGDGLTDTHVKAMREQGWFRAVVIKTGVGSLLHERPGGVNVGVANPAMPGGHEFAVVVLDSGMYFWYDPKSGHAVIEAGGNPALVHEMLNTGYQFQAIEPAKRTITQSMAPMALQCYPPPKDPLVDPVGGRLQTEEDLRKLESEGWMKVTVNNDQKVPFLWSGSQMPTPGGLYIAPMTGATIEGYTDGMHFVTARCPNLDSCWRWLC